MGDGKWVYGLERGVCVMGVVTASHNILEGVSRLCGLYYIYIFIYIYIYVFL